MMATGFVLYDSDFRTFMELAGGIPKAILHKGDFEWTLSIT
jgi:hypothetical protein